MNAKRGLAAIAGSLLLLAGPVTAHAAASSSASVGPFTIQLVDLNPLDGILPSIIWSSLSSGFGSQVTADASDTAASNFQSASTYGLNSFSGVAVTANTALSGAAASVVAGPNTLSPAGATLSASGHAYGTLVAGQTSTYSAESVAPSHFAYQDYFTLSANTALIVTANATVNATTSVGFQTGYGGEDAFAGAWLTVWGLTSQTGGAGSQNTYAELNAAAGYAVAPGPTYLGESQSLSGPLSGSFLNLTGTSMNGFLKAGTYALGSSMVAAVPEPETYAMYLAGLALMGATVWRKKR